MKMMEPIFEFGIQLIQSMQSLSPALDGVMKAISFLGTIEFYILLIPLIYWLVNPSLGMRVLLVLISTDFLSASLKQLLHQPRPYWVGDVKAVATETSYGVPSSHSSNSLAVWGYLAYRTKEGLAVGGFRSGGSTDRALTPVPGGSLPAGCAGRLAGRPGGADPFCLGRR